MWVYNNINATANQGGDPIRKIEIFLLEILKLNIFKDCKGLQNFQSFLLKKLLEKIHFAILRLNIFKDEFLEGSYQYRLLELNISSYWHL